MKAASNSGESEACLQQTSQIARGSAVGLFGLGCGGVMQFTFTVLVFRLLDTRESGIYFGLLSVVQWMAMLSRLGTDRLGLKLCALYSANGDRGGLVKTASRILTVVVLASAALAAGVLLFRGQLESTLEIGAEHRGVWLLLLAIPGLALSFTLSQMLRGMHSILASTAVQLSIPYGLAAVLLVVQGGGANGPRNPAVALSAGLAVSIVLGMTALALSFRRLGASTNPGTVPRQQRVVSQTGFMFAVNILAFSMSNLDILLLSLSGATESLGTYSLSVRTASLLLFGITGLNGITLPLAAQSYASGRYHDLQQLLRMASRWSLAMASLLVVVALVGQDILFGWKGRGDGTGPDVLSILLIGTWSTALVGPGMMVLQMVEQERAAAVLLTAIVSISLLGYAVAIGLGGALGAAFVTALAQCLQAASIVVFLHRRLGLRVVPETWFANGIFVSISLLVIMSCQRAAVPTLALAPLIAITPLIALRFLLLESDRVALKELWKRPFAQPLR